MLETLDHTILIGSTPTFLYFDLYYMYSTLYNVLELEKQKGKILKKLPFSRLLGINSPQLAMFTSLMGLLFESTL